MDSVRRPWQRPGLRKCFFYHNPCATQHSFYFAVISPDHCPQILQLWETCNILKVPYGIDYRILMLTDSADNNMLLYGMCNLIRMNSSFICAYVYVLVSNNATTFGAALTRGKVNTRLFSVVVYFYRTRGRETRSDSELRSCPRVQIFRLSVNKMGFWRLEPSILEAPALSVMVVHITLTIISLPL